MSIKIKTSNIKEEPRCNNENDDIDDAKHKKTRNGTGRGDRWVGWIEGRAGGYIGSGKDGWT